MIRLLAITVLFSLVAIGCVFTQQPSVPPSQQLLEFPTATPTELPLAFVPLDADGDGLFEDLNGNGRLDIDDVVRFYLDINSDELSSEIEKYDFNFNGRIDDGDIVQLFLILSSQEANEVEIPTSTQVASLVSSNSAQLQEPSPTIPPTPFPTSTVVNSLAPFSSLTVPRN